MKTALVIGSSGLVGRELLKILHDRDEFSKVIVLNRSEIGFLSEKVEEHIVDFDNLERYEQLFKVDTVFCALGTTMKKAKTKQQFVKVDFDIPLGAAKLAKKNQVKQFIIVTSMGANQHSKFFYNQVKGNIEAALKEICFPQLFIIRPSLLIGKRQETRFSEDLAQKLSVKLPILFKGPFQKFAPNKGETVAKAMYQLALKSTENVVIIESEQIEQLGNN